MLATIATVRTKYLRMFPPNSAVYVRFLTKHGHRPPSVRAGQSSSSVRFSLLLRLAVDLAEVLGNAKEYGDALEEDAPID
jgi:hypothetical protein